jgi:hypothetical protein
MSGKKSKLARKVMLDAMTHGMGIYRTGVRKWYNPMRWIRGPIYRFPVRLEEVYKSRVAVKKGKPS